jgi:hypothetical protein
MKAINTKNLDQDEARTLIAQLGLHAANLRGLLANSKAETIQPPKLAAGDDIAGIGLLVSHISDLESRLGSSCPQFAPDSGQVSGSQAARAVAGFSAGVGATASPKLSFTERILKARGVGSLKELQTKLSDMSHEEKMSSARRLKTSAH